MNSNDKPASEQIDDIIIKTDGWRGAMLSKLREVITQADAGIVEEVKWKKPSKPEGVGVWMYNGKNICMADVLKNAVRLTFPKGAQIKDPNGLFNTRLDSKSVRAIDFYESGNVDTDALMQVVREVLALK
jgi:hypothetical protein